MKANTINRPTLADFGAMLADSAQHYGTIRHDAGTLNYEETANDVLERLGDLAEELALSDISANRISALMEVVNEYAIAAHTIDRQETARKAAAALRQIITLWGMCKDYRPEMWIMANSAAHYLAAMREANANKAPQSHADTSTI